MKMDDAAVAAAEQGRFDVSDERTVAPRSLRGSRSRSPSRPGSRVQVPGAGRSMPRCDCAGRGGRVDRESGCSAIRFPEGDRHTLSLGARDLIVDAGLRARFRRSCEPAGWEHRIEVRADGFKPFSVVLDVRGGRAAVELTARRSRSDRCSSRAWS